MDEASLTDDQLDQLADRVLERLPTGRVADDRWVLSRRQLLGVASGALSVGALGVAASEDASAQTAAGQVGTSSSPVDVFAAGGGTIELDADVTSTSVTGGFEVTIDGDTYQFNQ